MILSNVFRWILAAKIYKNSKHNVLCTTIRDNFYSRLMENNIFNYVFANTNTPVKLFRTRNRFFFFLSIRSTKNKYLNTFIRLLYKSNARICTAVERISGRHGIKLSFLAPNTKINIYLDNLYLFIT